MDTRRANLRKLIEQLGGPAALAKRMKLSGPSYISQIVSGNRPLTEKTARKIETVLHLSERWLDTGGGAQTTEIDESLFSRTVLLVGESLKARKVNIDAAKFAEICMLAYSDAQANGTPDATFIARLAELTRG